MFQTTTRLAGMGRTGARLLFFGLGVAGAVGLFARPTLAGPGRPGVASPQTSGARVEVRAEVNARQVRVGDIFQLDLEVRIQSQEALEEWTLPDLQAFEVVRSQRGPTSSNTTIVNGRMSTLQSSSYIVLLRARAPGATRIGVARARVGGRVYESAPIDLEVFPARGGGLDARSSALDPDARFPEGEDLPPYFLDVRFDRDEVFVGQVVRLDVLIFARDQAEIEVRDFDPPKPPGFWTEVVENPARIRPTQRSVRGQPYLVYPLLQLLMVPLEAKEHRLDPLSLSVTLSEGGIWGRRRQMPLQGEAVTLMALPLPIEERPPDFVEGNVGRYALSVSVDKKEVPLGQPVTLTLAVRGEGHIGALTLPELTPLLRGARVFPPSLREEQAARGGMLVGTKAMEVLVQPQAEGVFTLPPLTWHYFDPERRAYQAAESEPIAIRVLPSGISAGKRSDDAPPLRKTRPLMRRVAVSAPVPGYFAPLYLSSLALPFGAGLGLFAWGRRRHRRPAHAEVDAEEARRQRRATMARARMQRDPLLAERCLLDALAARHGDELRGLELARLADALRARGVDEAAASALLEILAELQALRYAPTGAGAPAGGAAPPGLFERAGHLLDILEEAP